MDNVAQTVVVQVINMSSSRVDVLKQLYEHYTELECTRKAAGPDRVHHYKYVGCVLKRNTPIIN